MKEGERKEDERTEDENGKKWKMEKKGKERKWKWVTAAINNKFISPPTTFPSSFIFPHSLLFIEVSSARNHTKDHKFLIHKLMASSLLSTFPIFLSVSFTSSLQLSLLLSFFISSIFLFFFCYEMTSTADLMVDDMKIWGKWGEGQECEWEKWEGRGLEREKWWKKSAPRTIKRVEWSSRAGRTKVRIEVSVQTNVVHSFLVPNYFSLLVVWYLSLSFHLFLFLSIAPIFTHYFLPDSHSLFRLTIIAEQS